MGILFQGGLQVTWPGPTRKAEKVKISIAYLQSAGLFADGSYWHVVRTFKSPKAPTKYWGVSLLTSSCTRVFGIFLRNAIVQMEIINLGLKIEAVSKGNFPLDYP